MYIATQYSSRQIQWPEADAAWDQVDAVQAYVYDVYWSAVVIGAIGFIWFNIRAVSNLKVFSKRHVPEGPVSVTLWQFAPGLNLVKPYQLMMLYWSRSREHLGEDAAYPAIGLWWWLCWLSGVFSATLAQLAFPEGYPLEEPATFAEIIRTTRVQFLFLVGTALSIFSVFCLLAVTRGITRAQDRIHRGARAS